jgi:hypothetical protein
MMPSQTIPKRFKFARVIAWLFLVLSILLLFYTYYRAEIFLLRWTNLVNASFNVPGTYFKYYVISITGILFWGMVLRLKDEIKVISTMVALSLLVGLYLVEISLNFVAPAPYGLKKLKASLAGLEFDTRSKLKVYLDLKDEGADVVPAIHAAVQFTKLNGVPGVEPLFPFGGISKKTTVYCNENGKHLIYLSDRHGFNNPDSEWESPQTEWMLTGDSFVQGACVQPGEDMAGQIRLITGENVISLGMGGTSLLTQLASLKEYAEPRKPKIVLWMYYELDMGELASEKSSSLLMSYLDPEFSQRLIYRQREIDDRLRQYLMLELPKFKQEALLMKTGVLRFYNVRNLYTMRNFFNFRSNSVLPTVDFDPLFTEILKKARDRTSAWGGKLFFVYLPKTERYAGEVKNHDLFYQRGEVLEVVKSLDIPIVDIHREVFADHPDPLSLYPFRMRGHYTAEGYGEVIKAVISKVRAEQ